MFLVLLSLTGVAQAKPEFLTQFVEHYRPAQGSLAATASCGNCHTTPPEHNAYGVAVKEAMAELKVDMPDAAVFARVEKMSDANGKTFGEEMPARLGSSGPSSAPLIPPHSFHPMVIHFPIALFLFGALLDLYGRWRSSEVAKTAAMPCLVAGALSGVVAVSLGLSAAIRLGYGLQGKAETHMIFALSACACMLGVSYWRRKGPVDKAGYWLLLVLGMALLSVAGHLGGQLVFG